MQKNHGNILAIYSTLAEQRHRTDGQNGTPFGLYCSGSRGYAWQLRGNGAASVATMTLFSALDDSQVLITLPSVDIFNYSDGWFCSHKANIDLVSDIPCGYYYYIITVDGVNHFSEVFAVADISKMWRLSISHSKDTELVYYSDGYTQTMYLDGVFDRPTPELEAEIVTNALGRTITRFGSVQSRNAFEAFDLPDYAKFALSANSFCDSIVLSRADVQIGLTSCQFEFREQSTELNIVRIEWIAASAVHLPCSDNFQ